MTKAVFSLFLVLGMAAAQPPVHQACEEDLAQLCMRGRSLLSMISVTLIAEDDADVIGDGAPPPTFARPWIADEECLRNAYDWVSPPCRTALDAADGLAPPPPPPCLASLALLALLALAIFFAATVVKLRRRGRRMAARKIFEALHADPELKARVEAAAGVAVPNLNCGKHASCFATTRRLVLAMLVGFVITALIGPFLTLLATFLALLATALIAHCQARRSICCDAKADTAEDTAVDAEDPHSSYLPPQAVEAAAKSRGVTVAVGTAAVEKAQISTNTATVVLNQSSTNTEVVAKSEIPTNTETATAHAATQDPPACALLV